VAGQHRAVVEPFAERHVLVRAHRLVAEELAARVRDEELQAALGLALLHGVRGDVAHAAYESLSHQLNLS
jgi:hypothetical protein